MAVLGKVYSFPDDYRVQRIQAIAAMNGLTLEIVPDIGYFDMDKPTLRNKFPLAQFPAFETPDGSLRLVGPGPIARFVAESGPMASQLLAGAGGDAATRALVDQWLFIADQVLGVPLIQMVAINRNFKDYYYETYEGYKMDVTIGYQSVDDTLKDGQKFLVGEQLTLADIMLASALHVAQPSMTNATLWNKKTVDYTKRIMELPEMKAVFPEEQQRW
ncbi:glutathione S-transferase [Parachaetomium inaequale]|uniref:Glutathione S-transferase n=1 Tax=Parachaetomium inaequale TaxID=2588326 RepID=A0AAN6PFH9_9PEZI|nr:glutathione S-transferase [Parachaetomium inaequale]